jgi:hypothetical protein
MIIDATLPDGSRSPGALHHAATGDHERWMQQGGDALQGRLPLDKQQIGSMAPLHEASRTSGTWRNGELLVRAAIEELTVSIFPRVRW